MWRFTLLLMLTSLITVSASQGQTPSSAADYYKRGETRLRKGDLDGATADFTQALKLDPGMSEAHAGRGEARYYKKDFDGAIADYNEALELVDLVETLEVDSTLYDKRGLARMGKGDFKGAVADFTKAIELNPRSAEAYHHRGAVRPDRDGAIADYTKAIELAPRWDAPYFNRMWDYLYLSRGEAAHRDAAAYLRLADKTDERIPYAIIAGYLGLRQGRQDGAAKAFLDEWFRRADASPWPYPVLRYLRREITATDLLRLATDNDKMTEARAYVGVDLLLSGQREAALEHLRWVEQKGNKGFVEYLLAYYELRRLEAAPLANAGQEGAQRSQGPEARSEWVHDVMKEWEKYGGKYFQSMLADQPHATIHLRDSVDRAGLKPFSVWVLVDGEVASAAAGKDWTKSSPLRLSTGPHCIRIDLVFQPQSFEFTSENAGIYTLWLKDGYEDEIHLTGRQLTYKRIRSRIKVEDLINEEELKFSRDRPQDPKAAYAYCLKYVHARRSR